MIIGFEAAAAIFCFAISVYWMARADSANRYDADADKLRVMDIDTHMYNQCAGFASDVSYVDFHEICGGDLGGDIDGCLKDFDTRWTTVFEYNGVVLLFLSFSYAAIAVGAFIYRARVIGVGCMVFWKIRWKEGCDCFRGS